ncbi:type II secretion system protein [Hydrogenovibrio marinus]|nr:prepilin-type N-terminal cleavage/methylation domain-containing protein [Hydrogenovibrio marinus]BBN60323.1 prepilin-type N-terminal cleavage/methylation domain-containing protein [Hydrogenovibrio marinus]
MSQTNKMQSQKGFTLVEIAIVLVIIGLLLGGVLKGQELIQNARVKATQSEVQQWSAAVASYQERHDNVLPGDGKPSGTPNGQISTAERPYVFQDLMNDGLIKGNYTGTNYPSNKWGGQVYIATGQASFNLAVCYAGLDLATATELDTKMDDGQGATGDVRRSTQAAYTATNNTVCFRM